MAQNGQRILVVDDDPDIGIMLKLMLEYKGYASVVAHSEENAKRVLGDEDVQMIIMDMLLSGTNGTDLCRELRKDPKTEQLPILMISAHPNARELCLQAGADDFLLKPFDMKEIIGKIDQLLHKSN